MSEYLYEQLTRQIINAAHTVHNTLGYGFLEIIYHNALCIELRNEGLKIEIQKPIKVYYAEQLVGEYFADLIVDEKVIVEVKSVESCNRIFEAQLLNYLKATGLKVGLIINFGKSVELKRMIL
jgi:GxxExxY protein